MTYINKDVKNTCKIIKNVLQGNAKQITVSKINVDREIIEYPQNLANAFNEYFVGIGPNLASIIPDAFNYFTEFLNDPNPNSIFFLL